MPFPHKFQEHDFEKGFYTQNSILKTNKYNPEVLIVGTYNPSWSWNNSDFYYGRGGYMWPILANVFIHHKNLLTNKRTIKINNPIKDQIFTICEEGKISFADIVAGLRPEIEAIEVPENKCVKVSHNQNEFIWKSYKDYPLDLMGERGWLEDNVDEIIKFINENTSIKHVYFTFKSGEWVVEKLNQITQGVRLGVTCCSIFTPTANGFGKNLAPPFNKRPWGLAHCWIWNGEVDNEHPIMKPDYGHLDHNWLISKGVNPNNF